MSVKSLGTKGLAGMAGALMLLAATAAMPSPALADWHGGGGWHGGGWHGGYGWGGYGWGRGYGWGPGIGIGFWGYPYGYYAPYYGAYYAAPYAYPYYAPPVAYMPVRVAAAPAAAPAPVVQAQPQQFTVFFDFNKDTLTGEGRHVVDRAIAEARRGNATRIDVTGYTDLAGTHSYNQALSERRAETVRQYMVSHGIRGDEIAVAARGETNPRVPTPNGVREAQNRRVEIVISEGNRPVASARPAAPIVSARPMVRAYAAPPYGYRIVSTAPGWYPPPYPAVYRAN